MRLRVDFCEQSPEVDKRPQRNKKLTKKFSYWNKYEKHILFLYNALDIINIINSLMSKTTFLCISIN